jgi:hypothetical protein
VNIGYRRAEKDKHGQWLSEVINRIDQLNLITHFIITKVINYICTDLGNDRNVEDWVICKGLHKTRH